MALPWLAAFKVIPWADVLAAAPSVVRGARKLWEDTQQSREQYPPHEGTASGASSGTTPHLEQLEARIAALEAQRQQSNEVLAALAEQNSRLIDAIALLRLRTRVLVWVMAALIMALPLVALLR